MPPFISGSVKLPAASRGELHSTNRHFDLLIQRYRRQETILSKQNFPNVFGGGSG